MSDRLIRTSLYAQENANEKTNARKSKNRRSGSKNDLRTDDERQFASPQNMKATLRLSSVTCRIASCSTSLQQLSRLDLRNGRSSEAGWWLLQIRMACSAAPPYAFLSSRMRSTTPYSGCRGIPLSWPNTSKRMSPRHAARVFVPVFAWWPHNVARSML